MRWIESLIGLSPDNGSGLTEAGMLFALVLFICSCLLPCLVRIAGRQRDLAP